MRFVIACLGLFALAACEPSVPPQPQRGVGFADLNELRPVIATGESAISGPFVRAGNISDEAVGFESEPIELASAEEPPQALPPVEVGTNNPGISDEQDFSAVSSRESIQSDRARLEAQREAYVVIQPEALPTRPGSNEPSIVAFALQTTHPVGTRTYGRSSLSGQNRFDRNCAKYPSSDVAQTAFLKAGGPERDRYGLDPDGDGYACFWDPAPFRAAVGR